MKNALRLVLCLFFISTAHAEEKPCMGEMARDDIETNLTGNLGCRDKYSEICRAFFDCARQYDICVVSNGRVHKGNSAAEISKSGKSISFGINQSFRVKEQSYCVIAGIAYTEGMDPWWYYLTVRQSERHGGNFDEDETRFDKSSSFKTSQEFFNKTTYAFKEFIKSKQDSSGSSR